MMCCNAMVWKSTWWTHGAPRTCPDERVTFKNVNGCGSCTPMDYCVPVFCRRRKSTRCAPCGGCAANTSAMPDGASMGRGRGPPSPAPHPQKQNPVVYTKVWTYLHGNTHRAPTHLTATAG